MERNNNNCVTTPQQTPKASHSNRDNEKNVQTAFSLSEIQPLKHRVKLRSHSEEDLSDNSGRHYRRKDLQEEILEWIDVYNDKLKVKLLREKMEKLVEKLKKPGGQERMRMKIKKYMKSIPSPLTDGDNYHPEFPEELPNNIIRKLKKMYLKSEDYNLNRMESFKFYSSFKRTVMDWVINLPIRNKEYFGGTLTTLRDDIFNILSKKLKSVILNRPSSDLEYKNVLKSSIANIIGSSPINTEDGERNRKLADDLANDILNISKTFPTSQIQPTVKELKEFIADEMVYFLEKYHISMSPKRLKYLQTELVDALIGVTNIDSVVSDDVWNILRNIGKISEYKARCMSITIQNDYNDLFFRNNENVVERKKSFQVYSVYHNGRESHKGKPYTNQLIEGIQDWCNRLDINRYMSQDVSLNKRLIKDLAENIAKGLKLDEPSAVNKEIDSRAEQVYTKDLTNNKKKQLQDTAKNVQPSEIEMIKDSKYEKNLIRQYEEIIDEWVDILPLLPNMRGSFLNTRNKCVHILSIKIYNVTKSTDSAECIFRKIQEEIISWLETIPILYHGDRDTEIYKYTTILLKRIENLDTIKVQDTGDSGLGFSQIENALLDWLKHQPLYRKKSLENREIQEAIMTKLASKVYDGLEDEEISKYIKMLDANQNADSIKDSALQLKLYLQNLNVGTVRLNTDECISHIDIWLKYLPFDSSKVQNLEEYKTELVEIIRNFKFSHAGNDILKDVIMKFMKTLPLSHKSERFLYEQVSKLVKSITHTPIVDVPNSMPISYEMIEYSIQNWCYKLPIKANHSIRDKHKLIDNVAAEITKITFNNENFVNLRKEIMKFLTGLPIKSGYNTEYISEMVSELIEIIKDIDLYGYKKRQEVTIYGVSLKNNSNLTNPDPSGIKDEGRRDLKANLDIYAKQLVKHITEWFNSLKLNNFHNDSFKEVVINDLAGDIIDRHRYLGLNPSSRGTKEEELEHLKYQIFKWINKLVGEDNLMTIDHAADLMNRVQSIQVPTLVGSEEKIILSPIESIESKSSKPSQNEVDDRPDFVKSVIKDRNEPKKRPVISGGRSKEYREMSSEHSNLDITPKPTNAVSQNPFINALENAFQKTSQNDLKNASLNNASTFSEKVPQNDLSKTFQRASSNGNISQNQANTLPKIYAKYQTIFTEKANEVVNAAVINDESLAHMAKTAVYKGILNSFFVLKSNPEIENNYACFEFMLEDKVEELLDLLPHTNELDRIRNNWKISVLINAVDMLKEIHSVTDRPSFRQQLTSGLNRRALKELEDKECFGLRQVFLVEMANDYILEKKYKLDDPIKSNIYKQRLMKKLDNFTNHITREHKLGFKYINRVALKRLAMKVLDEVPIPSDDVLQSEVDEILLAEEIQQWYKELPTYSYLNDMDVLLRRRLIDILAKKLKEIDMNMPRDDPSKERLMKHEMTMFLEKKGKLQRDQDLNINFMVEELNIRLKNRGLDKTAEYSVFENNNPVSSTLARIKTDDILDVSGPDTVYNENIRASSERIFAVNEIRASQPRTYDSVSNQNMSQQTPPQLNPMSFCNQGTGLDHNTRKTYQYANKNHKSWEWSDTNPECNQTTNERSLQNNLYGIPPNQMYSEPEMSQFNSPQGLIHRYSPEQTNQCTNNTYTNRGYGAKQECGERPYFIDDVKCSANDYARNNIREMSSDDDERVMRVQCRCNLSRRRVCYDCNECSYIPCRYYF